MRKVLRKIFINNFKSIFYMLQNSNSKFLEIESINFKIIKNSNLGKKNSTISSRLDQTITPNLLKKGEWDYFIIKFIKKYLTKYKSRYSFFDIGANIGLISRQIITNKIQIYDFHCIEPEIQNFEILNRNLNNLKKQNIYTYNVALDTNKTGWKKIYINKDNFGDFSLLNENKNQKFKIIKSVNTNKFLNKIIKRYKIINIIYKSDIQGMDEQVVLSLNKKIIEKIKVMILEISNIKFLNKNLNKFKNFINKFDIKEDEKGNKITTKIILNKIKNRETFNLLLGKN